MAEGEGSDDDSQKTEEPTPKRLEEARKRGQVVHSREVNSWLILFTVTVLIAMAGPSVLANLRDTLAAFITRPESMPTDPRGLELIGWHLLGEIAGTLALPLLFIVAACIIAPLAQTGFLLTAEPLKPDISKISLIKGLQRLFSLRAIVEFVKGLLKISIVSIVGIMILLPYFDSVEHFAGLDALQGLYEMQGLMLKLLMGVLSVMFLVAILDYAYQRYEHMKKLRMSKHEIREEFKQTEGDPHVKARLRELRETRARQRMMQAVPEADVVITNPTHYAVALKYDPNNMHAPKMLAKGVDAVAGRIKDTAKEHKIPLVENAPLARALYDSMDIDDFIPQEHFKAVAEVISYVFKLRRR